MKILQETVTVGELKTIAADTFGDMIKAVVDVRLGGDDFIEFDSMINVRPSQGNAGRGVEAPAIRDKIVEIVNKWMKE